MGLGYCSSQRAEAEGTVILVPSLDEDDDKWCWKCRQYKAKSEFYSDAHKPSGIKDICKECDNKGRLKRYHKSKPDYFEPQYPEKSDTIAEKTKQP